MGLRHLALLATCCVAFIDAASLVKRSAAETRKEQEDYFKAFGYMGTNSPSAQIAALTDSDPDKAFEEAVKGFQHMAGLNVTGKMDAATIKMTGEPRCGNSDNVNMANIAKRRKRRYVTEGSRWGRNSLTYKITRFTNDLTQSQQRAELRRALEVWSEVSPLTFRETAGTPDIEILFGARDHGDDFPFDGRGRTLAHAFFPRYGGDAHFDDDEYFTMNSNSGSNLFQVAAHEFGHSLGLGHSDTQSALMAPFYRGYQPNFKLDYDDINGIQALYGRPQTVNTPPPITTRAPNTPRATTTSPPYTQRPNATPSPTPEYTPDYCRDANFDAITQFDGQTYAFRGNKVMLLGDDGIAGGWPKYMSQTVFRDLPANLDAAVHWELSNQGVARTYFFKGSQYWRFEAGTGVVSGYPRTISQGFRGLPDDIDSAFVWSGNGVTYFTKGSQYYRYARGDSIVAGYPRDLSLWNGLPSYIDAAFKWKNGRTYFFQGPNYYRFNDATFRVDNGYPRMSNYWWLGCAATSGSLQEEMTDNGTEHPMENEEDSNQFLDIDPESNDDDFKNVYSGQGHITALPLSLVFTLIVSHVVKFWL